MKESLECSDKKKKKNGLLVFFCLLVIVLFVFFVGNTIWYMEKQNQTMHQTDNIQNGDSNVQHNVNVEHSFSDIFAQEDSEEFEWTIEGTPVEKEWLYGYYLPMHCSDTTIANVDVVLNMFEEKEWSTYLSPTNEKLVLSAVPLLWNGSKIYLNLISNENLDTLNDKTGYPHGLAGKRSYKEMIRALFPEYGFTTVTYYDNRGNLYTIDCAYLVEGNDMNLVMIHYDKDTREYSLIPMEQYQVIREKNKITIYKDKNFVTYVPFNLCENASVFNIEAFCNDKKRRYEDIMGITYYNPEPKAETWPLYGCVYFSDGSKAPEAIFDFSKENQVTIRWDNKVTDYFGTIVEIEGSGEVTFSYEMVQDTGLILEKDGVNYYYVEKMNN